ncbi:MAG: aldehyde dehydrogenase family protein [Francisellaceae bacterium]
MHHYLNYIDGQWKDSEARLTVINPVTDEIYATIAQAGNNEADEAMEAANRCVKSRVMSDVSPSTRVSWMLKASSSIIEIAEEGASILSAENGKCFTEAKEEFIEAARYFEYYAGMADKIEGASIPLGRQYIDFTQYMPLGVSLQIIPWNFPVSLCARSLAPALAAGNAVVIKSPELSPLAITLLIKAIEAAGFPKGVIQLLCGVGSQLGSYLVKHRHTNQIVFTGSVKTGQRILQEAAIRAIPSVMELGGKSAAIVLENHDRQRLMDSVRNGIFFHAGQVCSAMSRLLIHRSQYDSVKADIMALAERLMPEDRDNVAITPVISLSQKTHILGMITRAKAQGAEILTGGDAPDLPGYFINPTVIEASADMEIAQEEVFGPVLVIMPFDTESQAIEIANNTPYGLCAGVFGANLDQTLRISQRLSCGQVFINEWFAGGIETPFGGVGLSGFGREKGQLALYNYVQTRNIGIRLDV